MSRAFVREENETADDRADVELEKMKEEWLEIQEKKLRFLLSDPKSQTMDQAKRNEWIRTISADIAKTRSELEQLRQKRNSQGST
jgi:hypothetical protein